MLLTAVASYGLSSWLGIRMASYRNAAGVPHPNVFATPESIAAASPSQARAMYLFNCAQRSHANFVENYPVALSAMLISGLVYPRLAAGTGIVWIFGRVLYALGYASRTTQYEKGEGRMPGFNVSVLTQVGFMVLVGKVGWDLLRV